MPTAVAGPEIERLIQLLARLPGLGPRSARRAALHLIKKRELLMAPLASALADGDGQDRHLQDLRQYRHAGPLHGLHRHQARPVDHRRGGRRRRPVGAGARARGQCSRYHVLGGTLSPLDGVGPQDLSIDALISRAHEPEVKELILALNATVDGQTTAHYITELLQEANVKVTRLGARRAGRRRTRLSRRGHAVGGDQAADVVLMRLLGLAAAVLLTSVIAAPAIAEDLLKPGDTISGRLRFFPTSASQRHLDQRLPAHVG